MDKLLFNESISSLKLNQGWFAEIPRDFLYLACSRHVVPKKEFVDKYGTDSHQSLEFYGDKVLSMIGTMIIFQMYGLKITPGQATQIYSSFSSNEALLDLAEHENLRHQFEALGGRYNSLQTTASLQEQEIEKLRSKPIYFPSADQKSE